MIRIVKIVLASIGIVVLGLLFLGSMVLALLAVFGEVSTWWLIPTAPSYLVFIAEGLYRLARSATELVDEYWSESKS